MVTLMDRALPDIYERFGLDTVLVPFEDKQCLLSAQERKSLTLAFTRTNSYQASLCSADVAVLCGQINRGLCGLTFADPQTLEEFLAANPLLANTLTTETPSGFVLWIRTLDFLPTAFKGERVRWLADTDAVVLRRRLPWPADWHAGEGEIMKVKVGTLNFDCDAGLQRHVLQTVLQWRWGPPFQVGSRGSKTLNFSFWAGLVGVLLQVRYRAWERRFECFDPEGREWLPLSEERLMRRIGDCINVEAQRMGCPAALSLKQLKPVLAELRVQFPEDDVEQPLAVARFIKDHVETCPGHDLTTRELHAAYCRCQSSAGLPAISQSMFEQLIGSALATRWGLRRSHSLIREGGAKCGYRGIRLKAECPPPASPGALGGLGGGVSPTREHIEPDSVLLAGMPPVKVPS